MERSRTIATAAATAAVALTAGTASAAAAPSTAFVDPPPASMFADADRGPISVADWFHHFAVDARWFRGSRAPGCRE